MYTDGDEEILNLKRQKFEFIDDDSEPEPEPEPELVGGCVNLYFACDPRSSNIKVFSYDNRSKSNQQFWRDQNLQQRRMHS